MTQISEHLCDKYYQLSKNLIDLIAKKARQQTTGIFNKFTQIQNKIKDIPADIEKLTEIKEYMDNIPNELEKLKIEMNKCFDIYNILEGFNYRFPKEDMDKKWMIYGSPKEIYDLIDSRIKELEKNQAVFEEKMKEEQEELKERIYNLD